MPTTQMNVRIDEHAKAVGDRVFASIGYSPTRVVRTIWEIAAHFENDPAQVEKMLREAEGLLRPAPDEERARMVRLAEEGPREFERFLAVAGAGSPASTIASCTLGSSAENTVGEPVPASTATSCIAESSADNAVGNPTAGDMAGDAAEGESSPESREQIAMERARQKGWLDD